MQNIYMLLRRFIKEKRLHSRNITRDRPKLTPRKALMQSRAKEEVKKESHESDEDHEEESIVETSEKR